MIQSLHIKNFQSHKDTRIDFSPTVTVITGDSDTGKTAVLRALRKVFRNQPSGDFFISYWSNKCDIEVVVDDTTITRSVTKSKGNTYTVGEDSYNNFGVSIPEEVRIALRLGEIQEIGKTKIDFNFGNQHDSQFMIGSSGIESLRGKLFSKITGSDKINIALVTINSDINANKKALAALQTKREELLIQINSLKYLDKVSDILSSVSNGIDTAKTLDSQLKESLQLATEHDRLKTSIENLLVRIANFQPIVLDDIKILNASYIEKTNTYKDLRLIWDKIKALSSVKKIDGKLDTSDLLASFTSYLELVAFYKKCRDVSSFVQHYRKEIDTTNEQLKLETQALEDYKAEIGVCPMCERPW